MWRYDRSTPRSRSARFGGLHHRHRLGGGAAQRLLAEDGQSGVEGGDGLFRVHRARGGDHQAVEAVVASMISSGPTTAAPTSSCGARRRPASASATATTSATPARGDRRHAVAADPADAEKPDRGGRGRGSLVDPPGCVTPVARRVVTSHRHQRLGEPGRPRHQRIQREAGLRQGIDVRVQRRRVQPPRHDGGGRLEHTPAGRVPGRARGR